MPYYAVTLKNTVYVKADNPEQAEEAFSTTGQIQASPFEDEFETVEVAAPTEDEEAKFFDITEEK